MLKAAHQLNRREILNTVASVGTATSLMAAKTNTGLRSVSALAWAPDGKVIAADWKAGKLHALALPGARSQKPAGSFNLKGIDGKIATALRVPASQVRFSALLFDRTHNRAVVAGEAGAIGAWLALITVDGSVSLVDAGKASTSSYVLDDAPAEAALWEKIPARSLLVTGMECSEGELFVTGLANADFSSTFRRIAYPFSQTATHSAIEMYHTIHNQLETRAPIRTFAVIRLDGVPYILAAYTCTPLVLIPVSELQNGKVRGKTIAELGYGNTPVSIVPFDIEYQGRVSSWVLVANSAKSADLISMEAIRASAQKAGLAEPVQVPFQTRAGVPAVEAPLTGLLALVDQDQQFLLGLRRDLQTAALDLVSFRKGAFFRLSDHVNEYDFPNYEYPSSDAFQQQFIRPFHRRMRTDEGYPQLVK